MSLPPYNVTAITLWYRLSGHTHQVCTGVALVKRKAGGQLDGETFHEVTSVTFARLDDQVLESYIQSGEPLLVISCNILT